MPDVEYISAAEFYGDQIVAMLTDRDALIRSVGIITVIHHWARADDPTGRLYAVKLRGLASEALDVHALRGNGPDGLPGRPGFIGIAPLDIAQHAIYLLSTGASAGDIASTLAGLHDNVLSSYDDDDQENLPATQPAPGS